MHNLKLRPLVAAAAVVVEEGEEGEGGVVEAETILPQSEPPRSSPVRSRNMSRARPSESRCQGKVAMANKGFYWKGRENNRRSSLFVLLLIIMEIKQP